MLSSWGHSGKWFTITQNMAISYEFNFCCWSSWLIFNFILTLANSRSKKSSALSQSRIPFGNKMKNIDMQYSVKQMPPTISRDQKYSKLGGLFAICSWPQVHYWTVPMSQWKCFTIFACVLKTKGSFPRALADGRAWPGGNRLNVTVVVQPDHAEAVAWSQGPVLGASGKFWFNVARGGSICVCMTSYSSINSCGF